MTDCSRKYSGQTHYKMISCNIWLPVVIHRSKTRNNALDVFWGIETIIMPLSRQPQKKSFCPVSHSLAPTFMEIFFIMRLLWQGWQFDYKIVNLNRFRCPSSVCRKTPPEEESSNGMRQELCLGLSEPFFLSKQNIGQTGTVTRECKIKPLK